MNQIQQLLSKEKFKGSRDQDFKISIGIESNEKLFSDTQYKKILDVSEQFNIERQKASNYVVYGKIEPLYDNGVRNFYPSLMDKDITFETFRNNVGRNWVIQVVYPAEFTISTNQKMLISNITNNNTIVIDSKHSNIIEIGDILNIFDEYNKRYTYRVLGINSGITYQYITFDGNLPKTLKKLSNSYITPRITNYERKFKILTDFTDYKTYRSGYSTNIFQNQIFQFHFDRDVNIENLTDFIGNPLTELYLAIVKVPDTYDTLEEKNNTFSVSSGKIDDLKISGSPNVTILSVMGGNQFYKKNDLYPGDVYEYDNNELTGKTIIKLFHKFNYFVSNTNVEFYYQPFYKMDVRKFSNGLEFGNTANTSNIPVYATKINDSGDVMWRDLLDIGYIEENVNGVNYPFLNMKHYLYSDIKFCIRRIIPITTDSTNVLDIIGFNTNVNVNSTGLCDGN